jgi:rod shape-determining protein MreD
MDIVPDLSLILLVFVTLHNGSMIGQIVGFSSGFVFDLLSVTPLGFSSIVRTIIGFVFGHLKGVFSVDMIAIPSVSVFFATLLKYLITFILSSVFNPQMVELSRFAINIVFEAGYNALLAPILFLLMNLLKKATIFDPKKAVA